MQFNMDIHMCVSRVEMCHTMPAANEVMWWITVVVHMNTGE